MKNFKDNNFNYLQHEICNYIINNYDYKCTSRIGEQIEIIGLSFELTEPLNNKVFLDPLNKVASKKYDYIYAKEFLDFMLSYDPYLEDYKNGNFIKKYPWTKKFTDKNSVPNNFSTAYGPKIKLQLDHVINLLKNKPNTRRAMIHILIPEDKLVWDLETEHEYPCCNSCQFLIRNKKLQMYVQYRSNNIYNVLPYDVYLMTNLMYKVAKKLDLKLGSFYFNATSAHIYTKELLTKNK